MRSLGPIVLASLTALGAAACSPSEDAPAPEAVEDLPDPEASGLRTHEEESEAAAEIMPEGADGALEELEAEIGEG